MYTYWVAALSWIRPLKISAYGRWSYRKLRHPRKVRSGTLKPAYGRCDETSINKNKRLWTLSIKAANRAKTHIKDMAITKT